MRVGRVMVDRRLRWVGLRAVVLDMEGGTEKMRLRGKVLGRSG